VKHITFIFMVVFLVGCASAPSKQYQADIKGVKLYGYLSKSADGSFYFSRFQSGLASGAWVRLNDGKPMWNTNCTETVNGYRNCRDNRSLFITGGAFYEDDYIDAYNEALGNMEGDSGQIQSAIAELNPIYARYIEARDRYVLKVRDAKAKVKFDVIVDDRSELYDNSINFLSRQMSDFSISSPIQANISGLVSDTDFNQMVSKYKRVLEKKTSEIKATSSMNVTCRYRGKSKYFVARIECPSSIPMTQSKIIVKPVIKSVTYKQVVPSSLKGSDKFISYTFNGYSVKITNNTNQFVMVENVSFYHEQSIATKKGINYDLPPQSVKEVVSLSSLPIDKEAISFYHVTKQSAQNTKVSYGIAIKYKLENGKSKTLYDSFNFSLYELIK